MKSGMTLIETIVAFSIIAIIIVVALTGFNTIAKVNDKAQETNKADEEMETLIASGAGFSNSENNTLSFTILDPENGEALMDPEDGLPIQIVIPGKILTYERNGKTLSVFQTD
jgi:prepilin-type N-terminal cleavage/methylation domain-containing protein